MFHFSKPKKEVTSADNALINEYNTKVAKKRFKEKLEKNRGQQLIG